MENTIATVNPSDDGDLSDDAERAFKELSIVRSEKVKEATESDEFEGHFDEQGASRDGIPTSHAEKHNTQTRLTFGSKESASSQRSDNNTMCHSGVSSPIPEEYPGEELDQHAPEIEKGESHPIAASVEIMASKSGDPNFDTQVSIERVSSALSNASHQSSSSSGWMSDPEKLRTRKKPSSYQDAQEEWEQVETVTADGALKSLKSPTVTYEEAFSHFTSANLDEFAAHIKPTNHRSGISLLWHRLTGPPRLKPFLVPQRDLLFTLGHCPFDNSNSMHVLILQTIYKRLTGTAIDCARYGSHWVEIGFQGEDPVTDLRGCGMLGLLNLLYFLVNDGVTALALETYRLSQDDNQNFPFCILGINISRIALQVLRDEKLNRECNLRGGVTGIFHQLYTAIFHQFYHVWKTQHKTIKDSGFVLNELENQARAKPLVLMKDHRDKLTKKGASADKGKDRSKTDKISNFSGICDIDKDDDDDQDIQII